MGDMDKRENLLEANENCQIRWALWESLLLIMLCIFPESTGNHMSRSLFSRKFP